MKFRINSNMGTVVFTEEQMETTYDFVLKHDELKMIKEWYKKLYHGRDNSNIMIELDVE